MNCEESAQKRLTQYLVVFRANRTLGVVGIAGGYLWGVSDYYFSLSFEFARR